VKYVHAYTHLDRIGGAETMAVRLYLAMKEAGKDSRIASTTPFRAIHERYAALIPESDYIRLGIRYPRGKDFFMISHHRKITTLYLLQNFFRHRNRMIHIAHNEFDTLKYFTLFPRHVVAVSQRVKLNLENYFKLPESRISVIYNAIPDPGSNQNTEPELPLRIVYPARVNTVKRQLELVRAVKEHALEGIEIRFCGDGPLLEELKSATGGDPRFKVLGMVEDMQAEYRAAHWVMLYTEREGLPVSLIEACANGLPVLCNDVGGNTEIIRDGYNGYIVHSYGELISAIRHALAMPGEQYRKLSAHARQVFEEKFTMEQMTGQYLSLIDRIEDENV